MYRLFNLSLGKVFSFAGLSLCLVACQPPSPKQLPTASHSFAAQQIKLKMPIEPIPLEQRIKLTLELPDRVKPGLGNVEGVSMYMGSIPLQWKQTDTGKWQADLYLGSCTEPRMTWRLTVPLQSEFDDLPAQISLNFESVAN